MEIDVQISQILTCHTIPEGSVASHYFIHIQTHFQFSLLPIHVIENKQLTIKIMPTIFLL